MSHLTVLYPEPNRFDKANGLKPFSSVAGDFFVHRTFDTVESLELDIRLPNTYHRPFRGDTRILGLGPAACKFITGDANLNKHRGYRLTHRNLPAIVTYDHLSCWEFNQDEDDDEAGGDDKDVGVTRKSNYLFWALADFRKLFTVPRPHSAHKKSPLIPSADSIVKLLTKAPLNSAFVLDIETRVHDNCLDAIGLGYITADAVWTYTIPIYYHNNQRVYGPTDMAKIYRALYFFLHRKDITFVGHNLAFDFSILHHYYHLPFPENYHDTMLFMHRDNANIDKSLSHALSYYTDFGVNHKGDLCPNTSEKNFLQLLTYNHQDLYGTAEVYRRQKEAAETNPSLKDAVSIANRAQKLTLLMSFTGMNVDETKLTAQATALREKLAQWDRIAAILTGRPNFNCNSAKQVGEYFYNYLNYEVLEYTESGQPSADEKTLYKIQLRQPNPVLTLILAYRAAKKELSMLEFKPYERFTSR